MTKAFFLAFAVLGFIYMGLPSPKSIDSFPPLPQSLKSVEPGDTYQVPDIAAYYSNKFRLFVTNYYRKSYQNLTFLPTKPLRLNHPPEYSYQVIKVQTLSTFLEEFVYPMRDSLFVNGFEPFYQLNCELTKPPSCPPGTNYVKQRQPKYIGATNIVVDGVFYDSKTIIRYYHSSVLARLLIWGGICLVVYALWKVGKKVIYA